jgi:hypothetical protein
VNAGAKKTPAEREPFDELQRRHAATQFSGLSAWSGALDTGMMWSIVVAGCWQ